MKVVLKENVKGLGLKHEIKDVSDGYANNFLIPKKLAEYATPKAIQQAAMLRSSIEAEREVRNKLAEKQLELLQGVRVVLKKKANEKGHLFEKIHPEEVSSALKEQAKIEIDSEFLKMTEPIKEIGEHTIAAESGKNKGEFTVSVEAE